MDRRWEGIHLPVQQVRGAGPLPPARSGEGRGGATGPGRANPVPRDALERRKDDRDHRDEPEDRAGPLPDPSGRGRSTRSPAGHRQLGVCRGLVAGREVVRLRLARVGPARDRREVRRRGRRRVEGVSERRHRAPLVARRRRDLLPGRAEDDGRGGPYRARRLHLKAASPVRGTLRGDGRPDQLRRHPGRATLPDGEDGAIGGQLRVVTGWDRELRKALPSGGDRP